MSDVFISYSRSDREKARRLAARLEQEGWSVWWDREIPLGLQFDDAIEDALESAKCIVPLWSDSSAKSDWVKNESSEGKRRGILVPVLLEETTIPLEFRRIQTAYLVGWPGVLHEEEFSKLLYAIRTVVQSAVSSLPAKETTGIKERLGEKLGAWARGEEKRFAKDIGHPAIAKLLSNTYDQWLSGSLSHLSENPGKVARTRSRDEFIDYLNRENGTWLRAALRGREVADDEFLVATYLPYYVMTN